MPEELFKLFMIIGLSLVVSLIFIVPVIIWRAIRRRPFFPKGKKIESANTLYLGTFLFGIFTVISFYTGRPYYGSAILIVFLSFVFGLVVFKKSKKMDGNESEKTKVSK